MNAKSFFFLLKPSSLKSNSASSDFSFHLQMANHHPQPSPPGSGLHMHHGPQGGHQQVNGHVSMQMHQKITPAHLASLNEVIWLNIGS